MLSYIRKRLLMTIPTFFGVALLTFFMLRVVPGDVVEYKLRADGGTMVSEETIQAEKRRLGLDKPLWAQFGDWAVGLATLDLGKSMWTDRPVIEEIGARIQLSLQVAVMAVVFGVAIAVPLGTLSALYRGTYIDQLIRVVTIAGIAMPPFWTGMLLLMALLALFQWLPPLSFTPIYEDPVANIAQLMWPAMAIGYRLAALVTRVVRSSLLEVLNEDYIRTARAKGVHERVVIRHHALRNALLPAVTVVGVEFGLLVGGLVVTEQVFNLNGIGRLFVEAVARSDFMLIQGLVLTTAAFFIAVNLVVDVLYALLDPRIQLR